MLKLLPDLKDCDILADKAYGTKEIRTYLHDQFARYTIPLKVNTKQPWPFDKDEVSGSNPDSSSTETRCPARDSGFFAFLSAWGETRL